MRDRDENLNILDQERTKLEMKKCQKFINSIYYSCLLMMGDSWKIALKGTYFALLIY